MARMGDLHGCSDMDLLSTNADVDAELSRRGYKYGWFKADCSAECNAECEGYIYILHNEAFPQLVKIGYATDIQRRMKELQTSGVPKPFHCFASYGVKHKLADFQIHQLIDGLNSNVRYSDNREFYEMSVEDAYKILLCIATISGTSDRLVKNPYGDSYFGDSEVSRVVEQGQGTSRGGKNDF